MEPELLKLKIGIIVPSRGDREVFLDNCERMMEAQTLHPYRICLQDYKPESDLKDITQRYRLGYASLFDKGLDLIAFIEDDDYYSPCYLETMVREWLRAGQPDLIGTGYTIYYHLRLRKYFKMMHPRRASAMNTLIKPGLKINWCEDSYPFTDMWLWNMTQLAPAHVRGNPLPYRNTLSGHIFIPEKTIAIGLKHGVGLCGGNNHIDRLERYEANDFDMQFLKQHTDDVSFEFYRKMSEEMREITAHS